MPIPPRFNALFSWSTSALIHVAVGGAIAHWGGSAVIWFSDTGLPPGQAVTLQARFASAAASSDQPFATAILLPDSTPPKAKERAELSPQPIEIERTLAKTETSTPVVDHGELVPQFVSAELTEVVPPRKPSTSDEPQATDEELAAAPKHSTRRLAEPSLSDRDLAADDADVRPSIAGADEPPKPFPNNPSPGYPTAAIREGRQGRAVVLMLVSAEGKVVRAEILKSSGWADLDAEGLAAVKQWKFIPARRQGVPVAHEFVKPWDFHFEN